MAFLNRLIVLALLLVSGVASAATQPEVWYPNQAGWSAVFHKTAVESCQYYLTNYWGVPYGSTSPSGPDTAQCFQSGGTARGTVFRTFQTLNCTGGSTPAFSGSGAAAGNWQCQAPTCPANATWNGTACACNAGYEMQGGACVVPPDPGEEHCQSINGSPVKASWTTSNPSLSTRTICMSNAGYSCTATVTGDICGAMGEGGPYLCHGSGVSGASGSGTTCTPSPEPDAPPPSGSPDTNWPEAPAPGMCPGTVNGVSVTVPCSSTSTKATTTSTSNDGEGNTTSKSESKSTTCNAAGSCTTTITTTTTVNGGTPKTTTSSTTQGKGEFCAGNPGAKECGAGDGSSFGGNCQSSFVCTGDAVQCATAKAVNDSLCKFKEVFDMDPSIKAYAEGVMAGTEDPNPRDNPTVINLGTFDQSNPLSSGCPADIPVNLHLFSTVIPLSEHCGALQMLGNMLVIFSLLGATIFVLRGGS